MWRRQLSTFDRSSKRGSRMGVVVVSLMATPGSCCFRRTLPGLVRRTFCKDVSGTADSCGRRKPAHQLLQARLEHASLRFDIGAELVHPVPHLALELAEPQVLCADELVVAPLELLPHVRDAMLQPLRAGVSDVCQAFRQHRLGFAGEALYRALELAGEALRCFLARGLHELCEPLGGLVGMRGNRAVDGALELLDLPA